MSLRSMNRAGLLCAAMLIAAGASTYAQKGKGRTATKPVADKTFFTKAAEGGMAEVELGQLAAKKGANPAVKQFGERMVSDHSKANEELKSIAQQKDITLPKTIGAKNKALMAKLERLNGAAFDSSYMSNMVRDHKEDVAEFKSESTRGRDADAKSFAGKTLPTLEEHLKMAMDTQKQLTARSHSTGKAVHSTSKKK